jgi:hypothetical protein
MIQELRDSPIWMRENPRPARRIPHRDNVGAERSEDLSEHLRYLPSADFPARRE